MQHMFESLVSINGLNFQEEKMFLRDITVLSLFYLSFNTHHCC